MAEYVGGKEKLVNVGEPIIFENKKGGRNMTIEKAIHLEDMKKIMKESLNNAKTYGDFLDGIIIGAYKLGIEHGKVSCQETKESKMSDEY